MTKQEVLKLMISSLNEDNLELCERSGMDKDQTDKMIEDSQFSLQFMVNNMYDRMKAAGVLNS